MAASGILHSIVYLHVAHISIITYMNFR